MSGLRYIEEITSDAGYQVLSPAYQGRYPIPKSSAIFLAVLSLI